MNVYEIEEYQTINRAKGDDGAEVFTAPDICDLTNLTAASFKVIDDDGVEVFEKTLTGGTITITGQDLGVDIEAADVVNLGSHKWILVITTDDDGVSTIGAGKFCIIDVAKQI